MGNPGLMSSGKYLAEQVAFPVSILLPAILESGVQSRRHTILKSLTDQIFNFLFGISRSTPDDSQNFSGKKSSKEKKLVRFEVTCQPSHISIVLVEHSENPQFPSNT